MTDDADDADDGISPWARDDWTAATDDVSTDDFTHPQRPPGHSTAGPVERPDDERRNSAAPANPPRRTHVVLAGLLGVGLLIAGTVALVRADDAPGPSAPPESTAEEHGGDATLPRREVVVPGDGTMPAVDDPVGAAADDPAVDVSDTSSAGAIGEVSVSPAVVGEIPVWSEWTLQVPSPLDAVAPTELVALSTDRVLHRVEFPAGQVRSVDLGFLGDDVRLAVGDGAVLLYSGRTLVLIRDDEPILDVPAGDGVIFAQRGPEPGTFLVTTVAAPASAVESDEWILGLDGELVQRDPGELRDAASWARSFLPDGRLLVNGPGGVYAIAVDGAVSRVSSGDLLALGTNHYAVEECDGALRCSQYVVHAATGDRVDASLAELAWGSSVDPSNRLSPDGRYLIFSDVTRDTGIRQIVDTATGAVRDIGPVTGIALPDTWTTDGRGLFDLRGQRVRFHPSEALPSVEIGGFGPITAIGVHPPPPDPSPL